MDKFMSHDAAEWHQNRIAEKDARIVELEHQLDIRKAAVEAQFRLMAQVKELEKALTDAYSIWSHAQEDSGVADRMADVINAAL